ncbi:centromere protein P [Ochotona princeps]|uniref:centromere protein P n=1 Tax=Ochotona princeps TaxID=9978 RepID=UPI0027153BAD|nr:centromere protein P [Ochotona princeps]
MDPAVDLSTDPATHPLRAEARALQAEIAALRRACDDLPVPWKEASRLQPLLRNTQPSDSAQWDSAEGLRAQVGRLESELSFLSALTGISIGSYWRQTEDLTSTEMAEKGIKKVVQKYRLSGNCHVVTFQLEFQVLEIQDKENSSSVVTDFNIIMEPTEFSELSEFVSRAEEKRDIFMFFRSLHYFVKWYEFRKRTFKHFKEKYPHTVRLPEGTGSRYMSICSTRRPGFALIVVWRIQIDEEGKVSPKLDLLTQVPQQALELDKNNVTEMAPLSFRSLLSVLGIEGAVESLIQLFCAENK